MAEQTWQDRYDEMEERQNKLFARWDALLEAFCQTYNVSLSSLHGAANSVDDPSETDDGSDVVTSTLLPFDETLPKSESLNSPEASSGNGNSIVDPVSDSVFNTDLDGCVGSDVVSDPEDHYSTPMTTVFSEQHEGDESSAACEPPTKKDAHPSQFGLEVTMAKKSPISCTRVAIARPELMHEVSFSGWWCTLEPLRATLGWKYISDVRQHYQTRPPPSPPPQPPDRSFQKTIVGFRTTEEPTMLLPPPKPQTRMTPFSAHVTSRIVSHEYMNSLLIFLRILRHYAPSLVIIDMYVVKTGCKGAVEIVKWGSREILCNLSDGASVLQENDVHAYNVFQDQLRGVVIKGQVHEMSFITVISTHEQLAYGDLYSKIGDVEAVQQVVDKMLKMIDGVSVSQTEKYKLQDMALSQNGSLQQLYRGLFMLMNMSASNANHSSSYSIEIIVWFLKFVVERFCCDCGDFVVHGVQDLLIRQLYANMQNMVLVICGVFVIDGVSVGIVIEAAIINASTREMTWVHKCCTLRSDQDIYKCCVVVLKQWVYGGFVIWRWICGCNTVHGDLRLMKKGIITSGLTIFGTNSSSNVYLFLKALFTVVLDLSFDLEKVTILFSMAQKDFYRHMGIVALKKIGLFEVLLAAGCKHVQIVLMGILLDSHNWMSPILTKLVGTTLTEILLFIAQTIVIATVGDCVIINHSYAACNWFVAFWSVCELEGTLGIFHFQDSWSRKRLGMIAIVTNDAYIKDWEFQIDGIIRSKVGLSVILMVHDHSIMDSVFVALVQFLSSNLAKMLAATNVKILGVLGLWDSCSIINLAGTHVCVLTGHFEEWDPGGDAYFFLTTGSLQFKLWDPGECSLMHGEGILNLEVTWRASTLSEHHHFDYNLEDKVDFDGEGNVMSQHAEVEM